MPARQADPPAAAAATTAAEPWPAATPETPSLLVDTFTDAVPEGHVVGSPSPDGRPRSGIDREHVMRIADGALRLRPLCRPGWGRLGIAYGPFARRPGLALTVALLNGDHGSQPYPLDSLVKRVGRWLAGRPGVPALQRLRSWRRHGLPRRDLRRVRAWTMSRFSRAARQRRPENLAVGWFGQAVPDDPSVTGSAFLVRAEMVENGQLCVRSAGGRPIVVDGLQNVPMQLVVALRDRGAAYYAASLPGVRGMAAWPLMRPLAIDPAGEEHAVHAGLHQSMVGEYGFSADTVVHGLAVAEIPSLRAWYGSAHLADPLTGCGALDGSTAERGGIWTVPAGRLDRTPDGLKAAAARCMALITAGETVGLLHLWIDGWAGCGEVAVLLRAADADNHVRFSIAPDGCYLDLVMAGRSRCLAAAAPPRGGASLSVQLSDDGRRIRAVVDGVPPFGAGLEVTAHVEAHGIGLATDAAPAGVRFRALEAHPRTLPIPPPLRLPWPRLDPGDVPVFDEPFATPADDLDGLPTAGGGRWHRLTGHGRFAVVAGRGACVLAGVAAPLPDRTAYAVDWSAEGFADLAVTLVPPGTRRGDRERGRGGVLFWQDPDNHLIVNVWLNDFVDTAAVSAFFTLDGFEELYDAVWSNVGDRLWYGRPAELRVAFDGDRFLAWVDGEPVLYRALSDIRPGLRPLRIRKVGLVANWEWGTDTGTRFLRLVARTRAGTGAG